MLSEHTKILEFNQYQKFDKAPFVVYADLECIIEKIDGCKNNNENSSTTKVSEHIPSGFSMFTVSLFRSRENRYDVYRVKDCIIKFCEFIREHVMKKNYFKKEEMKLLTKDQQESYEHVNICCICKENLKINIWMMTNIVKLETIVIILGVLCICNLKYYNVLPKKIPIVFHNGPNYDYHIFIKELAAEFKKQFTCLGENTEKYITFTVPIEKKVTRIDKNGAKITKKLSYILQFIDSARFVASSLSNLVNNLSETVQV